MNEHFEKGTASYAHKHSKSKVTRRSVWEHTERFAPSGTDLERYENGRTLATGVLMMSTGTGFPCVQVRVYDGYLYGSTVGRKRAYVQGSNKNFFVTRTVQSSESQQ